MNAQRYRKKPVVIEAVHFDGDAANCTTVTEFLGGSHAVDTHRWKPNIYEGGYIRTLEGEMEFIPGDWIIKGVKGEFYPCKPEIFAATYEAVPPQQEVER